jgi:outer membrane protein, heavy metal efflux system
MGSKRSKSDFHWQLDRRLALATYALAACCFVLLASCTTSKSEIVKESPIHGDQSGVIPAKAAGSGEYRSLDGNNTAVSQGDSTTAALTISSNSSNPISSNPIQFGTNSNLIPRDNLVPGTQAIPPAPTNPYATLAFSSPATGSTQPISTTLPNGNVASSLHQVSWSENGAGNEPARDQVDNIPGRLAESNQTDAGAKQAMASVLQYALEHHPALRVRQHEVEAARARLITARLLPNPELMLQTLSPTDTDDPSQMSSRLMFTVPIGPKRAWRSAVAQTGIYEAQMALGRETKTILTEAADAAIEVLYLQEQASLYDQLTKLSDQIAVIQKERFKAVATPYRSVVVSELTAYNTELARRNTVARLNQAKVRLARAMGMPDGSPPPIEGQLTADPLTFPPLPAVLCRAGQTAPELAQSCGAIQESKQQHVLERWKAVPDIAIGPRLQNDLSGAPNDRVGGRFQVDLPIFNRNQGNIAESAADIQTNCAKYDLIRVATLNDVASLYVELQDVQSRAEYSKSNVHPLTEQTERALREAFENREVTAYELTELLGALARMKLGDLDLRHEHYRLRTRLELLLECPISAIGGDIPPQPPESLSIPIPHEMPVEDLKP